MSSESKDPKLAPRRSLLLLLTWCVIGLAVLPIMQVVAHLDNWASHRQSWLATACEALAMPIVLAFTFVFFAGRYICVALAILVGLVSISRSISTKAKLVTLPVGLAACIYFWRVGFNGHM